MTKLKIVHAKPVSSFNSTWIRPIFEQVLEFELWDPSRTYAKNTLFYLNCLDFPEYNDVLPAPVDCLAEQGFKIIIDNLWEVDPGPTNNAHRVCCDKWFWYNESLWYQHLGYHTYRPNRKPSRLALMPMNKQRLHRTVFLRSIQPLLDKMIWSYVEQGQQLPWDGDMTDWNTQRRFVPDWYDQTYLNMVVETLVRPGSKHTPIFITEKTTKPLAFQQPLVVYGNRGTLRTLRSWGFETFDNLWDESYDEIVDVDHRLTAVVELLKSIKIVEHSTETLRRLQHNRNHFFDRELIHAGIIKQILEPIIEYAETNL